VKPVCEGTIGSPREDPRKNQGYAELGENPTGKGQQDEDPFKVRYGFDMTLA
jgi:hypothetical protein